MHRKLLNMRNQARRQVNKALHNAAESPAHMLVECLYQQCAGQQHLIGGSLRLTAPCCLALLLRLHTGRGECHMCTVGAGTWPS